MVALHKHPLMTGTANSCYCTSQSGTNASALPTSNTWSEETQTRGAQPWCTKEREEPGLSEVAHEKWFKFRHQTHEDEDEDEDEHEVTNAPIQVRM